MLESRTAVLFGPMVLLCRCASGSILSGVFIVVGWWRIGGGVLTASCGDMYVLGFVGVFVLYRRAREHWRAALQLRHHQAQAEPQPKEHPGAPEPLVGGCVRFACVCRRASIKSVAEDFLLFFRSRSTQPAAKGKYTDKDMGDVD